MVQVENIQSGVGNGLWLYAGLNDVFWSLFREQGGFEQYIKVIFVQ